MELTLEEMLEVYRTSDGTVRARFQRELLALMNRGLSQPSPAPDYATNRAINLQSERLMRLEVECKDVHELLYPIPDCKPHATLPDKVKALIVRAEKAEQYVQALQAEKEVQVLFPGNTLVRNVPEEEWQKVKADAELGRLVRAMPVYRELRRQPNNWYTRANCDQPGNFADDPVELLRAVGVGKEQEDA